MKRNLTSEKNEGVDRVVGNKIILYDFFPKEHRVLKTVEIITKDKRHIRRIIKTQNGRYLINK